MKSVRITIAPPEIYLPPLYRRMTIEAEYLTRVQIINWNVSEPPVGFLLRIHGEYRRFGMDLADDANVWEYEILPITERQCYCFLAARDTTAGRALFENFTRGNMLTIPPIECHDDGSSTFTLIGTDTDIHAAVDGVPKGVDVTIEAVGGKKVAPDSVVGQLSVRQREAVETASRIGYYDIPREATSKDIAKELGCATATASEHLRRAESKLIEYLFGE